MAIANTQNLTFRVDLPVFRRMLTTPLPRKERTKNRLFLNFTHFFLSPHQICNMKVRGGRRLVAEAHVFD